MDREMMEELGTREVEVRPGIAAACVEEKNPKRARRTERSNILVLLLACRGDACL